MYVQSFAIGDRQCHLGELERHASRWCGGQAASLLIYNLLKCIGRRARFGLLYRRHVTDDCYSVGL